MKKPSRGQQKQSSYNQIGTNERGVGEEEEEKTK
jgi:hypothetical protein